MTSNVILPGKIDHRVADELILRVSPFSLGTTSQPFRLVDLTSINLYGIIVKTRQFCLSGHRLNAD